MPYYCWKHKHKQYISEYDSSLFESIPLILNAIMISSYWQPPFSTPLGKQNSLANSNLSFSLFLFTLYINSGFILLPTCFSFEFDPITCISIIPYGKMPPIKASLLGNTNSLIMQFSSNFLILLTIFISNFSFLRIR